MYWLKMKVDLWNSPTGEAMEYCVEDYEINLCSVMKRISFALLLFEIAPCGCLLLLEKTYVCMSQLKQGAHFPSCSCPYSSLFCLFFFPSRYFCFCSFSVNNSHPCKRCMPRENEWKMKLIIAFCLKKIYIYIQSNLISFPSVLPC